MGLFTVLPGLGAFFELLDGLWDGVVFWVGVYDTLVRTTSVYN